MLNISGASKVAGDGGAYAMGGMCVRRRRVFEAGLHASFLVHGLLYLLWLYLHAVLLLYSLSYLHVVLVPS